MKNPILTFILLVIFSNIATAQFKTGESFISGAFYNNLTNVTEKGNYPGSSAYNHYINLSVGKFVRDNRALGWGLTHSLITESNTSYRPEPAPLKELSFGIE